MGSEFDTMEICNLAPAEDQALQGALEPGFSSPLSSLRSSTPSTPISYQSPCSPAAEANSPGTDADEMMTDQDALPGSTNISTEQNSAASSSQAPLAQTKITTTFLSLPKQNVRKAKGNTYSATLTLDEVNSLSQLQGEDLVAKVEEGKLRRELPKYWSSEAVRLVDGEWVVPRPCNYCQNNNKQCNRHSQCATCTRLEIVCTPSTFMDSKTRKASLLLDQPGPIINGPRGQNSDGSWFNSGPTFSPSPINFEPVPVTNSEARSLGQRRPTLQADYSPNTEMEEADVELRGLKRKADDTEFTPSIDSSATNDQTVFNSRSKKRKTKAVFVESDTSTTAPKKAYHVNAQLEDKPEPFGKPLAWAFNRQQLCETFEKYRAYQSAAYTHDKRVHGFMCDKEVTARDVFTDQILISRIGGGRVQDKAGNMVQSNDQGPSGIVDAFQNSMKNQVAVLVIAAQGNHLSPSKLPHYYNVLGWFHITYVWSELIDGCKTWKARFEKIDLDEKSWWAPKNSEHHPPQFDFIKTEECKCTACKQTSNAIFDAGWTCLRPGCSSYFKDTNGEKIDAIKLVYSEAFLRERTRFLGPVPTPESIAPKLPTDLDMKRLGTFGIEAIYKKGIVCPHCGCCSRRIEWNQWTCENKCGFSHIITQQPIPASEAIREGLDSKSGEERVSVRELRLEGVTLTQFILGNYTSHQYGLPDESGNIIGFVCILKANGLIRAQRDGPNDLFLEMQKHDFGLLRHPVRGKGSTQETLTAHWTSNWGAPYKFAVATISQGFDQAPLPIIKALLRMTWAGKEVLKMNEESFQEFNELLSVGYFEESHMGYHDDGEKELGPTVASLSLGATSTMAFRAKAKNKINVKQKATQKGDKSDSLRITLEHGDIMVMHGSKIQQLYEHTVIPHGKLRFALTSRYIRPEMMSDEASRKYTMAASTLPVGSEQYHYDGDVNAKPIESKIGEETKVKHMLLAKIKTGELSKDQVKEILKELS